MGRIIDRRRVMGGKLPYDAEIEYLQGDKASWINTEYYPTTTTEIEVKQYWDGDETSIWFARVNASNTVGTWRNVLYMYAYYVQTSVSAQLNGVVYIGKGTAVAADGSTYTYTPPSTRYSIPIGLFGGYSGFAPSGSIIYYFKVWEDDALVLDLIPVRVGQVGYMYDKVSKQLFGNNGTGAFILGPDK